ncbi:protein BatD [candidate division WOR-3 bacterium]|nr:protein BatD [candidate division WOR-3 bacterium]
MVILLLLSFTFTAFVDRTTVPVGEYFIVTVSASGENISGLNNPIPPEMDKVDIISRSSSHSTQIQFINGKVSKSTTINYEYRMLARKKGEFTIPPFTLKYKGKDYKTDPIKIQVVEASQQQISDIKREERKSGITTTSPIFIDCSISDANVYPGEGVIATFKLYSRVNLADVDLVSLPSYQGVWVEEIQSPKRLDFKRTVKNGITYSEALLKQVLLFPLKSGEIEIKPMEMDVELRGDIFSFFGERKRIASPLKKIKVKPFPEKRPEYFIDGVGTFRMSAELDSTNIVAGTPFPLRIRIKGKGNLNFLSPPELPEMRRINTFRPESEEKTQIKGNTIQGERIFTYLLTCEESGILKVPEIKWSYFNSEKKRFVTKSVGPFTIRVKSRPIRGDTLKIREEDIAFIMPVGKKSYTLLPRFFVLWLLLPLIILIGSGYYVWERRKIMKDSDYARIKAIPAELQRGFQGLQKVVEQDRAKLFYQELSRLLLRFLRLRFGIEAFSLQKDELLKELKNRDIQQGALSEIDRLLKRSEEVRFAAGLLGKQEMEEDIAKLKRLIRDIH